jgi:hypothetical protein
MAGMFLNQIAFTRELALMNRRGIVAVMTTAAILVALGLTSAATPRVVAPAAFELPPPTGRYAVGTTAWRLTDSSRLETFTTSGEFRQVEVTRHLDFCDMVFWGGPLRERPVLGTIVPARASEITSVIVRQYFDQELLGQRSALLAGLPLFPEVSVRTFPPPAR